MQTHFNFIFIPTYSSKRPREVSENQEIKKPCPYGGNKLNFRQERCFLSFGKHLDDGHFVYFDIRIEMLPNPIWLELVTRYYTEIIYGHGTFDG